MSMVSGDQPRRRARMTSRAGGTQDSGEGEKELPVDELPRNVFPQIDEFPRIRPRGFGGSIPSPRQSYETLSRRPAAEGGDRMERERIAQLRSLLGQMQMPVPPMPGMSDMGSTVPGEGMNRPAPDINDAFFGPDRKRFDVVEFLMGLMGRR